MITCASCGDGRLATEREHEIVTALSMGWRLYCPACAEGSSWLFRRVPIDPSEPKPWDGLW
jgi:hypothetical protein